MVDSNIDKQSWTHFNPVRIVCEPLESLAKYARGEHILLVTTPGFIKRGVVDRVKQILGGQKVSVWDGVKPNPDLMDLDEATKQLKALRPDCIVGLGGGSALDAAKVLATTLAHVDGLSLIEVFRYGKSSTWNKRLGLIAIPTTAGTGSEVTPFATVWDHQEKKKHSLTGDFVFPDVALLDATLTLTLGYEDTLYPALDTVSHALESIWNINKNPITLGYAYESLKIISNALPQIKIIQNSLQLRRDLQSASVLGGLAISQTKTAIAHALSYPLTLHYGVPHGLACSFTLPALLTKYIDSHVEKKEHNIQALMLIKQKLEKLDLGREMGKYINTEDLINLMSAQPLNSRLKNYSLMSYVSVESVIRKSII